MRFSQLRKRGGFTLIELLLSLTLGAVVTGGSIYLYVSNKTTNRLSEGIARLQENERFALFYLRQGIEQAGLPNYSNSSAIVNTPGVTFDTTTAAGDSLTVRYRGASDCLGLGDGTLIEIQNQFYVENGQLMCQSNLNAGNAAEAIVDGVDHLQVLYGVDSNGDGVANQYLNATAVRASSDPAIWHQLVNVRLALLLNTVEPVQPGSVTKTFTLLDGPTLSFNDAINRQLVSTTVLFRNRVN